MTLRLILMRHAKSSWDHPDLSDHERPLNDRGRRSAQAIGRWLKEQRYLPDQVMSSDSTRTAETWTIMSQSLGTPRVTWTHNLYHAGAAAMMNTLQTATGHTVLMLAHNPGIADFAERLVTAPPDHQRFRDYPTAATTVMEFAMDEWKNVAWHTANVQGFIVPRDLPSP